uniref:Uncharacterized protein n=1 Tax=Cucumis melo TaxID=3656 RepID=A0A9I9CDC2_CUCME
MRTERLPAESTSTLVDGGGEEEMVAVRRKEKR